MICESVDKEHTSLGRTAASSSSMSTSIGSALLDAGLRCALRPLDALDGLLAALDAFTSRGAWTGVATVCTSGLNGVAFALVDGATGVETEVAAAAIFGAAGDEVEAGDASPSSFFFIKPNRVFCFICEVFPLSLPLVGGAIVEAENGRR